MAGFREVLHIREIALPAGRSLVQAVREGAAWKPGHGTRGHLTYNGPKLALIVRSAHMNTPITMIGTIGTVPERRVTTNGNTVCRLRLACSDRRYDREKGAWVDGETSWITVITYRGLAEHAHSSFNKGDRIIVSGRLRVRPWQNDDGKSGVAVELEADACGHDVRWGTSKFTRATSAQGASEDADAAADGAVGGTDSAGGSGDAYGQSDAVTGLSNEGPESSEGSGSSEASDVGELVGAGGVQPPY